MFLVRYSPATAMFNGGMQSVMKRYLICFIYILTLSISSAALGSQPMDEIRDPMDKIIQILRDPQYQSASQKADQRQKIWLIVDSFFDFKEISRRTLARFWKDFTPEQQQEFVDIFSEFLADIYLKRIQGEYKNEKHKSTTSNAANECLDLRFMAQRCLMAVLFNRDLAESRVK